MAANRVLCLCFVLFLSVCSSETLININFSGMLSGLSTTPTSAPSTAAPTAAAPSTASPTAAPSTASPTAAPTTAPPPIISLSFSTPFESFPVNQWVEIGNTSASHGTGCAYNSQTYAFFVRKGTQRGVAHVELQGGGACFDPMTCNPSVNNNLNDVSPARQAVLLGAGTLNHTTPLNPYRDWTHVYVSYCTGDFHFGNKTTRYGNLTVDHRGIKNTNAVREWLLTNLGASTQNLVVTGCSAGGFGSILTYPIIRSAFPNATRSSLLIDSASTVVVNLSTVNPFWNIIPFPTRDLLFPVNLTDVTYVAQLHDALLTKYPNDFVGSFFHTADYIQVFYSTVGTQVLDPSLRIVDELTWQQAVKSVMNNLLSRHPNFRVYIKAGNEHCVTSENIMYQESVAGVRFVDWMSSIGLGNVVVNVDGPGFLAVNQTNLSTR